MPRLLGNAIEPAFDGVVIALTCRQPRARRERHKVIEQPLPEPASPRRAPHRDEMHVAHRLDLRQEARTDSAFTTPPSRITKAELPNSWISTG